MQPNKRPWPFNLRVNACRVTAMHCISTKFLARDVIYTSRAYAMMPVRLSCLWRLCTGHRVRCIPDIFACLDKWMSLLLTDNAWLGSSDGMMSGFVVEEGGMEKVIIVAISLILMDRNHVTYFLYERVFNNNNINICIAPYGRNFRGAEWYWNCFW